MPYEDSNFPFCASNFRYNIVLIITIYKGLVRKGVDESELPNPKKTGAYLVTRKEANNTQEMKNKLTQYANEDKWFKSFPSPKAKVA